MSVSTWDGMEVVVIEDKGNILGKVSLGRQDIIWHDGQSGGIARDDRQ
jgi:hypothetical protein